MASTPLHRLAAAGQSAWLDSLSRELLASGALERMLDEHAITGVTSNPTIFQAAISGGDDYDGEIVAAHADTDDETEIYRRVFAHDVRDACDVLRPVWERAGGRDGFVSFEVDPRLAYEPPERTVARAEVLAALVDRPNLLIKIPATDQGIVAIEDCTAAGRSINATLIFSLARYRQVAEAYLRGLERLVEGGGDPSAVASVASFFVSRVDTETDRRLEEVGDAGALALRGRLAVANARLAYASWGELFSGPRWEALAAKGAAPQRCLWASTSAKNPAYRDVVYVEELIGPETVNTMPLETVEAFQDHGVVAATLVEGLDEARALLDDLARAGVDYEDVTATLEREGVEKFVQSFEELLAEVRRKAERLGTSAETEVGR